MKSALIVHNPSAGNAGHSREELLEVVQKAGYSSAYVSVENDADWKSFRPGKEEVIFVVGGDGTVRKLAGKFLNSTTERRIPIHLFPRGTANNIARTLQISTILDRHAINIERMQKVSTVEGSPGCPEKIFLLKAQDSGFFLN